MNDDVGPLQIDLVESNTNEISENGDVSEESAAEPIDLKVQNVVTMFSCCCHVDLRKLALATCHVVYERNKGVIYSPKFNEKNLKHKFIRF